MKDLRKIKEGMCGEQAATAIYLNDSDLYDKIQACEDQLTANKAYVAQINDGGKTVISVVSSTGSSTTDVMSQSGVTGQIDSLNERIDNTAFVADLDVPESADSLNVTVINATYAQQANYDDQGHSLSGNYYSIEQLKTRVTATEAYESRIKTLEDKLIVDEARITALENLVKQIIDNYAVS